jgi:pantetheine-phosphate adenylyltransferase
MIEQGARLFGRLAVALGVNPAKKPLFSPEDRLAMLRDATAALPGVSCETFGHQFLIDYAKAAGARYILRGIRSESDYEYERAMRNINGDLAPSVTTVFLMPPREIAEVSSSFVKGLIGPAGWPEIVRRYVPDPVFRKKRAAVLRALLERPFLYGTGRFRGLYERAARANLERSLARLEG